MTEKKISIIIPAYNEEGNIRTCVKSILDNQYSDLEIICIDDGSTDATLQSLNDLAEEDSRIIVIHQDNSGISVARNKGLELSTGEYISFIDADDTIHPRFFSHFMECILKSDADLAICGRNQNSLTPPDFLKNLPSIARYMEEITLA